MADDTYTVTRSVTVDAPPERVYEKIVDFHRWPQWSPWEDLDPNMRREYSGNESGTGAVYGWSGNNKAGQGRMEIVEADPSSRIRIDLAFERPFKSRSETTFAIEPTGTGSRVTWTMVGQKTMMVKIMGLFRSMDKMVGPDFEKGLGRLKAAAERPGGE